MDRRVLPHIRGGAAGSEIYVNGQRVRVWPQSAGWKPHNFCAFDRSGSRTQADAVNVAVVQSHVQCRARALGNARISEFEQERDRLLRLQKQVRRNTEI